jgi:hypothetical protein
VSPRRSPRRAAAPPPPAPTEVALGVPLEAADISARTIDPATAEIAFRAARRFKEIAPQLTSFAKAITGNDSVRVVHSQTMTATDGITIRLRPPMKLGVVIEHQRLLCGKRNARSQQLCPACAQMDDVFASLFHEIAHIAFDSFKTLDNRDRAQILSRAVSERPALAGTRHSKLRDAIAKLGAIQDTTYPVICNIISPYLHPMVNALEDARVNREMYRVRPGTYAMFRSIALEVFDNGIMQDDGTVYRWDDAPENAQVIIGLYCKASGFDYSGWFQPEIVAALDDPQLSRMVKSLEGARSVGAVYRQSFPILERLRELGYCKLPDDLDDDEPEPEPASGDSEPESSSGDSDDDTDDEESGTGASGDDGRRESGDGDDTDDEAEPGDTPDSDDDTDDTDDDSGDGDGDEAGSGTDDDTAEADTDDGDGSDDDGDGDDDSDSPVGGDDSSSGTSGFDDGDDEADDGFEDDDDDLDDDDEPGHTGASAFTSGTPDEVTTLLEKFGGHETPGFDPAEASDAAAMDVALVQADTFEAPSSTVWGVNVMDFSPDDKEGMWARSSYWGTPPSVEETMPPESLINRTVMKARIAFADNKRAASTQGLRSGRPVSQLLPSVMTGNNKVFSRNRKPAKRDYFVGITLDVSGSTGSSGRIELIRELGMAMGELFSRLGVEFSMFAHTGGRHEGLFLHEVQMYRIKARRGKWDSTAKQAVASLVPYMSNLDGHTLEFMRRQCDEANTTNKIILYVTDGSMPAENYDDELSVLKRELKTCAKKGYDILGVGVQNDDPTEYGLDTVRLDTVHDLPRLVDAIDKRLTRGR